MSNKVVDMKVSQVIPYENNPRQNDGAVESVANSIMTFGFKQPIVVDKDNIVIVGHTRLKAAIKLGLTDVPVIVADDLTDDQVKAYRLADNRVGELADWDATALLAELDGLVGTDINIQDFGFNGEFFDEEGIDFDKGNSSSDGDAQEDDFDPEPVENPTSQLGQIYQLGRHRLMVGDSTDSNQVAALLDNEKADLLLTDPPYNIGYSNPTTGHTVAGQTILNERQTDEEYVEFLKKAFSAGRNWINDTASFYIWHDSKFSWAVMQALAASGLMYRQTLIWKKNAFTLGRPYRKQFEVAVFGSVGKDYNWYNGQGESDVLEFDRPMKSVEHPTMKPVALFDYQMKNSSKEGDIVLDLFGGSGTTMIAAEQNGRSARLMELDPRYADTIINRWEELTGEKAVLVSEY